MASAPEPLPSVALRHRTDPASLPFGTTEDLEPLDEVLGQDRAVEAIRFGTGVRHKGYNVFALGSPGSGRHTVVRDFLERRSKDEPVPSDWCYVHNFEEPRRPCALRLPPGRATGFREDVEHLVEELRMAIPAAFEAEDYRARREALDEVLKKRQEAAVAELQAFAKEHSVRVVQTPVGFALQALSEGKPLSGDEAEHLPKEDQQRIERNMEEVKERLETMMEKVPRWQKEHREQVRELDRETSKSAVVHLIDELRPSYEELPGVLSHLDAVEEDAVDNVREFLGPPEPGLELLPRQDHEPSPLKRYRVNVLVDNTETTGAPVILEDHPTLPNLIGRLEHVSRFGALTTDFTLIKAGALHCANGGYLVLDARKVLTQAGSWDLLKRVLRSGQIKLETLGEMLGLATTVSLDPEPIPLDLKVVLVGDRHLYYLLRAYDPELAEHFKVAADFEDDMEGSDENVQQYAALVAKLARDKELRAFDRGAVARVVDEALRWAEDSRKLSTNVRSLADLLVEADHWSREAGHDVVQVEDVQRAIDQGIRRLDRVRDRIQEAIREGRLVVETGGGRVGQVNALSVIDLGGFAFGRPNRVTARVRLGKGDLVDIEREVALGGPIHSKGVLILSGFVGGRYAGDRPLPLSASLVFEQSYGGVEGDSASMAELCALLSALSELPIDQRLAITGSVDQHGRSQAVGGINEKIEGFFDVCRQAGELDGHGVIIPASTVRMLMLREDVVEAAEAGRFRIWPVRSVDEAMHLLTGVEPGECDEHGHWPEGSVNRKVDDRLSEMAAAARALMAQGQLR